MSADRPDTINIYADTFADKNRIADVISRYNDSVSEDDAISYTDYVALLMSSVTDIISGVSYLLIAFVSISLVVSSIMIGIITYISVLERTREIGILRAIGASKHEISSVFNAETLIVGFVSGMIGIGVSVLLLLPDQRDHTPPHRSYGSVGIASGDRRSRSCCYQHGADAYRRAYPVEIRCKERPRSRAAVGINTGIYKNAVAYAAAFFAHIISFDMRNPPGSTEGAPMPSLHFSDMIGHGSKGTS